MKLITLTHEKIQQLNQPIPYFDLLCLLQWRTPINITTYVDSPHSHDILEYCFYTFAGTLTYTDEANHVHTCKAGSLQLISPLIIDSLAFSDDYHGFICGFDPELMPSLHDTPLFQHFSTETLPLISFDDHDLKTLIGPGSPARLAIDCHLFEGTLQPQTHFKYRIEHGRHCGIFVVSGQLNVNTNTILNSLDCQFMSAMSQDYIVEVTANEFSHFFIFDLVAQR